MLCDLGVIEGPVVLFGGPYSNLHATEALLREAATLPGATLICTGDVVAYCADPAATTQAIMDSGAVVVAGNCEQQIAANALECGCGFEAGTACDLLSKGWFSHASAGVTDAQRGWMAGLPDLLCFTHHGRRIGVLHGGVGDVARFLWSVSPDQAFAQEWAAFEALAGGVDAIVAGHSGIPFIKDTPRGQWVNAGVIGIPPHDGSQTTRFVLLHRGRFVVRALHYDALGAQAAMVRAGLTQGYHDSLVSGYWPSEEVLPSSLRVLSPASG
ncbi:MAG: metallophosphoesterase [Roseobacter sp.]